MQHEGAAKKNERLTQSPQQAPQPDELISPQSSLSALAQRAHINPQTLKPQEMMRLQRTIGNRAAIRLLDSSPDRQPPLQRKVFSSMDKMWKAVVPGIKPAQITNIINSEPELATAYADITLYLDRMDFQYINNKQPEAKLNPGPKGLYEILYGKPKHQQHDFLKIPARFAAYILHEMMHVTAALQYDTNVAPKKGNAEHMANMNLPKAEEPLRNDGLGENQFEDIVIQLETMITNWNHLLGLSKQDLADKTLSEDQQEVIENRVRYAQDPTHYDTVLVDLLFYLTSEGGKVKQSKSYLFAQQMLAEANIRRKRRTGQVPKLT